MTEIQKTYVAWMALRAKAFATLFVAKLLIKVGTALADANLCPMSYVVLTGKVTNASTAFTKDANEALENLKSMLQ